MSEKVTNPKDMVGTRKVPLSTLPFRVLWRVGLAMMEGALKYGRHNYRAAGVRASVYFDAVVSRHLGSWWEGEDIDTDSRLHHIDKAIAGLMVLRDGILQGNWVDDRPPRQALSLAELNDHAGMLIDMYAGKEVRHFTIADSEVGATPQQGRNAGQQREAAPPSPPVSVLPLPETHPFQAPAKPTLTLSDYIAKAQAADSEGGEP